MCVSIETEAACRRYVAELVRVYGTTHHYPRSFIDSYQRARGWLLDYDLTTCQRKVVEPPKPVRKPRVHTPGMKVVREAIREIVRTPAPVEKRAKEKSLRTSVSVA